VKNKMKLFSDRRIRLILLLFVIAGAEAIGTGGVFGTFAVFCEVLAFIWLVCTLFAMLRDRKQQSGISIGGIIYKAAMRLLSPVVKRIRRNSDRKTRFVKGTDTVEFLKTGKKERRSKRRSKKQKIDIDREAENREKVRLSYIKYVLSAAERGRDITYSDTPFEIREKDGKEGTEKLFEVYSGVRYGNEYSVSDADAELCKAIAEGTPLK